MWNFLDVCFISYYSLCFNLNLQIKHEDQVKCKIYTKYYSPKVDITLNKVTSDDIKWQKMTCYIDLIKATKIAFLETLYRHFKDCPWGILESC